MCYHFKVKWKSLSGSQCYIISLSIRQKSTLFECQRIWHYSTNWHLELTLRTPFLHLLQKNEIVIVRAHLSRSEPCKGLAISRQIKAVAPVVQKLDSAVLWINVRKTNYFIHWKENYPVDSVIHLLNNGGLQLIRLRESNLQPRALQPSALRLS